jgi:hypothetical protein
MLQPFTNRCNFRNDNYDTVLDSFFKIVKLFGSCRYHSLVDASFLKTIYSTRSLLNF